MSDYVPRYLRGVVALAEANGWRFEAPRRGSGHCRLYPPDGGRFVEMPGTPSDYRGHQNMLSKLRRAGLDVPHKGFAP